MMQIFFLKSFKNFLEHYYFLIKFFLVIFENSLEYSNEIFYLNVYKGI